MNLHTWLGGLAWVVALPLSAQEPSAIDTEQRLRTLEDRLDQIEAQRTAPAPAGTTPRVTSNAFNPAISLILDGKYASFKRDPANYVLPGFSLAGESGPGAEGLRLDESELALSANVDDKFFGLFTAAVTPDDEIEVEEAFIETLALGHGTTLRAGRFFSGIGYLNSVHAHAWDFVDQPLVYRALLGDQYRDDGLQLRWLAPTDTYLEVGAELLRGDDFPAGGATHAGKGTKAAFVRIGGDIGVAHAWRLGLSGLNADADARESGDAATPDLFTGKARIRGIDAVWKWAPNGNSSVTNLKIQAEWFRRTERGTFDPASSGIPLVYDGTQHGWYAQAIYQFMPRWRVGVRHDRLRADAVGSALAGTALDNQGHDPKRASAMLDFANSEFSRVRLQYNRDDSRADGADDQWYAQYVMSLGAHGAHAF